MPTKRELGRILFSVGILLNLGFRHLFSPSTRLGAVFCIAILALVMISAAVSLFLSWRKPPQNTSSLERAVDFIIMLFSVIVVGVLLLVWSIDGAMKVFT